MTAHIKALINQKGGVGKTSCTINYARVAINAGMRVLVIDADPQGNLSGILAAEDVLADQLSFADVLVGEKVSEASVAGIWPNLDVLPGNQNTSKATQQLHTEHGREFRLKEALTVVESEYDLVLIDCAPSLDLHTVNALTAADQAVVITQPGKFSLDGLSELVKSFDSVQKYYNPLLTVAGIAVNGLRNTISHRSWISELEQASPWLILHPYIPLWSVIQDAQEAGYGLDEWKADAEKAREAYEIYARHFVGIEGLDLEGHLSAIFPHHDYSQLKEK